MNHKKTFQDYMPVILSCTDQPIDHPCKSIVFKLYYYTHTYGYMFAKYCSTTYRFTNAALAIVLFRKLLNNKMTKTSTELLVILKVSTTIQL